MSRASLIPGLVVTVSYFAAIMTMCLNRWGELILLNAKYKTNYSISFLFLFL